MAMTEDWSIDVRKYVPNADSGVIAAIVRYCGIALQNRDSSLVSFSDDVEVGRVRENYLKKKLGLTNPDAELNAAIAAVGERMKGDRTKNRVTVYYLLAEHFRKLSIFGGDDTVRTSAPRAFAAEEAGVAAAATAGVVGLGDRIVERERPATPPPVTPAYAARSSAAAAPAASGGLPRWLPWLLGLAALLAIGWFLLAQRQAPRPVATVAPAVTPTPTPRVATAPAAAPAVIVPETAPATPAAIVGLPANVHFALGSSALGADERSAITNAAEAIKRDSLRVAVTGYTDRTGNLTANEALAQRRAIAVRDALVAEGVPTASIEMRAPAAVENGPTGAPDLEARRVEINRL